MIITYQQFINESQVNPYLPYLDQISNDRVKQYLRNNDPAADDNFAIRWASEYGKLEVVKVLLQDKRVDPSDVYNHAIRWASQRGHVEVVRLLLKDPRVNPAVDNNTPLMNALLNENSDVARLLLSDPRVDPSNRSNTLIRSMHGYGRRSAVMLIADYFCGGKCELTYDKVSSIISNCHMDEIHHVIARKNQSKIAKQQGFGDEDDLLDLF